MTFLIATVAVYGYVILLSLWAMRVQRQAAGAPHHPHDHPATRHVTERSVHGDVARLLAMSLAVRLTQLTTDLTPWVLVPLTVVTALVTVPVLTMVWRMASEDFFNWFIVSLSRLKTALLLACVAALVLDQAWRVVTLFWF
jgi:hypothetical protein